ncbi:hypothetical protein QBC46DRAFT_359619 [Diplogelasinospora grovesii]|uniref:Bet v1-like protein n=1 Tax=Diplogelasinospora grovesii TaxID=303347 RepID=A0AAN6RYI6_9PEZI|nr:hypothetical protein QBC46DRAFT_359619 [Diplogelasinospora grovesii]
MSNSKPIPTSNEVIESAVIAAPLSHVWHLIKLRDFSKWWSAIDDASSTEGVNTAEPDVQVVNWKFKDGTVLQVKQDEHSNLDHFITYSVINSEPALAYSSVVSTIRCWPVTSGEKAGCTYVQWTSKFSSDADAGVIQDAKFKRRDALADLARAAAKK